MGENIIWFVQTPCPYGAIAIASLFLVLYFVIWRPAHEQFGKNKKNRGAAATATRPKQN